MAECAGGRRNKGTHRVRKRVWRRVPFVRQVLSMSSRPSELHGDKASITSLAQTTLSLIAPGTPRDWLLRLAWTGQSARRALGELRALGHGPASRDMMRTGERYGLPAVLWWVAMVIGSVLTLAGAALLLPPRRSFSTTLEGQLGAAPILFLLGAIILLVLTCLPVPGEVREAHNGLGVALAAGAITLISLTYNVLRLTDLREASTARTAVWFSAGVLALVACLVLVVRTRPQPPLTRFHWRASAREAFGHARWLHAHAPALTHSEMAVHWEGELARQAAELDAEVVAQARALGPWWFLAAAYLDGEIEVPRVPIPPPNSDRAPQLT